MHKFRGKQGNLYIAERL